MDQTQVPQLWDKKYTCPACGSIVTTKKVITDRVRVKNYDPDMKPNYEGINPMLYSVVTCENCHYSALESDFENNISPIYMEEIRKIQNELKVPKDVQFSKERDHRTAILSCALGTLFYKAKKQICRVAELYLRIGWLYRELSDSENELKALAKALASFEECFMHSYIDTEKEPMILFYLGELSARFGKMEEARKWFSMLVTKYKNSNSFYVKAGRDRWQEIKG
ncbi:MAG: DUF2225 domain-containing protein [Fervidobacterium sp.]|uniref:DUF2225 domain-containing protein n=1 Tax=Fervidobacterium gondwanense DSM 13020 TaxID=1121883 RepID=A0A1M7RWG2_FERGO|nr:DUF2225 domain-containing protein [Fervidobacterium gondwanense]UXF00040.1 hypothetical protein IB67_00120 [Fervidobacterium riparium]SHN50501.1 hypothetical protein SAMN02745226_00251 [Fervidobacterium gondwanense DSM 13020]